MARMKITRRPPPVDFGASNDDAIAPVEVVSPASASASGPSPTFSATRSRTAAKADAASQTAPIARSVAGPGGEPSAFAIYLTAFAVAVLWALGPIAFAVGYRSGTAPLRNDHFAMLVFALLAIGPAALVFGVAYFVRQGQKLAAEARRTRELEQILLTPALRAAAQAGEVTKAVREEIASAAAAADLARESLESLRQALRIESENLVQATHASLDAAQQLNGELGRERGEMQALAQGLDSQAARVAEIFGLQAQKVAEMSQGAEAQLREAERALAASAHGLTTAAGDAGLAARTAGEDLTRHIARLETAGAGVADQVRAVEGGLTEQRAALMGLIDALRGDHQTFAAEADAHAAKLDTFIDQTRRAAGEMSARAADVGETLRSLIGEAADRFAELSTTAQAEREAFGETAAGAFDQIARHAADQRSRLESENRAAIAALGAAAEETRQAAARHAAAAREQVDQLSEAAFAAGQKANQVFEARLEEAKALVDHSSRMVGDAGAAAARKLDEGAAAARAVVAELGGMLEALEVRARELPGDARVQAEAVRAAVAQGLDALMAQARRTAEEAQSIDAAFQDRVRRNFDMLSEAVRLMGTVAAAPPPALTPSPASDAPAAVVRAQAAPSSSTAPPAGPSPAPKAAAAAKAAEPAAPASASDSEAVASGAALAERLGLRPRLKLTPTATDEAFSAVFETPSAPKPAQAAPTAPTGDADNADDEEAGETWTWKDLLASLSGEEAQAETEVEEAQLAAELGRMGVEPEKLVPDSRIDQVASALQAGDIDGARQVVKRLAGAASRRIVRRLFTDESLRNRAADFVRRYQGVLDDAAVRDPQGDLMASLLGCEAGRVYLLLDQALGDAV
jgi:hypothetical protein